MRFQGAAENTAKFNILFPWYFCVGGATGQSRKRALADVPLSWMQSVTSNEINDPSAEGLK